VTKSILIPKEGISITRRFSWLLVVAGFFGFIASADLSIEKIRLLEDPTYQLSCNINAVLACGSVVTTDQASVFGFANSLIGMAAFPVLFAIGLIGLVNYSIPKYFLIGVAIGSGLANIFIQWLVYQSLYVIEALCPWCMVVWVVSIPVSFFAISELNKDSMNLKVFARIATTGWFFIISALIVAKFYI
jgi:uncharacterized membrane protein